MWRVLRDCEKLMVIHTFFVNQYPVLLESLYVEAFPKVQVQSFFMCVNQCHSILYGSVFTPIV